MKGIYFSALLGIPLCMTTPQVLAQESGWERAGRTLGEMSQSGDEAYRRRMAENMQLESARQNLRWAQQSEKIRETVYSTWIQMGYTEEEARAYTQALNLNDLSDFDAIALSMRGLSPQQMGDQIRAALAARQFEMANKLLLAALGEIRKQQAATAPSPTTPQP